MKERRKNLAVTVEALPGTPHQTAEVEDAQANRLLIVDDDPLMCKLIAAPFKNKGYIIASSHSMEEALSTVVEFAPDVVLLDIVLPDGNGLDAIPSICSVKSDPAVIMVTGDGDIDGAELAIRRGAWSYIIKGENLIQVVQAVEEALSCRKERHSALPREVLRMDGIVGSCSVLRNAWMPSLKPLWCAYFGRGHILNMVERGHVLQ